MMKDLLKISQLNLEEIEEILSLSWKLQQKPKPVLKGKNILFAFEKPSLRTKVGTEVAINHLGGNVIHIEAENFFQNRESMKDAATNAAQWCDAIFARVYKHETLENLEEFADIPVVNALCDQHHPMQALADLLTLKEVFGEKQVALAFIGDANNVCFSLFELILQFGYKAFFAGPEQYGFSEDQKKYLASLGDVEFLESAKAAAEQADVIYTDTFVSMGEENEYEEKMKYFSDYQVNADLLEDAYFMHCLPAHRGVEVTDEVIDGEKSLVYQQAKNRMVVSKGVFTKLLTDYHG